MSVNYYKDEQGGRLIGLFNDLEIVGMLDKSDSDVMDIGSPCIGPAAD